MSIDFGALPPEVNSARMYSGPGSTSLMNAASAWNALAAELNQTALGYDNVVTQLASEEWMGPASASMAAAVQPYVEWMSATSAQAEQAATQARAAAAAYEAALVATVPLPLVAANRAELAQLMSTNVLGQNTAAIAANEAQYGEMWAQDATAMYGYAGQSAAATKVTPFTAAPQIASPTAQAVQTAAVTSSGATAAGTAQSTLTQLVSGLPSQLQNLALPLSNSSNPINSFLTEAWFAISGQNTLPNNVGTLITGYNSYSSLWYNTEGLPYFSVGMANFGVQIAKSTGGIAAPAAAAATVPKGLPALGGMLGGGAHVAGSLGNAASVGRLSVPAAWSGAAPALSHAAPVTINSLPAAAQEAGVPGNLLGGMPLAGAGAGGHGSAPRYGFKPTVMARPPLGG
jgi:PPE-repeat protein